jgi:hypothetical protein
VITYTAANTKTGKFYIGSAKDYCNYMNRRGNHHVGKAYNQFRKDLQANPHSFSWEWSEDNTDSRDVEASLLALYVGSPWCYNTSKSVFGVGDPDLCRINGLRGGYTHTEDTKAKIGQSVRAAQTSELKQKQRETAARTNAKRVTCPHCGLTTNPGNLTQHLNRGKCKMLG